MGYSLAVRRNWQTVHALFSKASLLLWAAALFSLGAAIAGTSLVRIGLLTAAGTLLATVGLLHLIARMTDHKRSHDEDVLKRFLDSESAPSILLDHDHTVLWANAAARQSFPSLMTEGVAKGLRPILPDPASLMRQLHARLGARERVTDDIVTRHAHMRAALHRMGQGRVLLRLELLTEKGGETGTGGSGTAVPLLTVSAKGTILSMNEAMRQMVGHRARRLDEVLRMPLTENGRVAALSRQDAADLKVRLYHSSLAGDRREIAAFPVAEPDEVPSGPGGTETLPVAILHIGQGGSILSANGMARRLLGLQAQEDDVMLQDLVSGLGRSIPDWIDEAIAAPEAPKPEVLRLQRAVDDTYIQISLGPGRADQLPEVTAILHDATELKSLEAQFVQSQKMQAIGQLAGGVAHDFNNLLTAISGHCDLLLLRHDQGDGDYADLVQINQNANRASALVGQLLAFSRKQTLLPEVLDLRDALADLTHLLNRLVGETVTLSLLHDPDLPHVRADKRQLEQVVMNLVVNARDAMPEGGDITIETRRCTLTEPLRKARAVVPMGEYACISVCDQGTGIPPELLSKIFEPFYTTKRTGEGTGLGLSTAYGIVKQSGGFIFVDSIVGRGTEFTLYFPAYLGGLPAPPPLKQPSFASAKDEVPAGEAVILLVEDEAPVRAFAARALRLRGYTVLEARTAEEALEILASDGLRVDLFVTDVVMPGLDGPSWVRQARQRRPDTKAVFMSGYAEDLLSGDPNSMANAVFLPKPFSLQDLTTTVQSQLG